ncbi:MAG: MBL fold metallo-hydrolase [Christensenellales bacterium]
MLIRYLYHSGFAVELKQRLVVFDYFRHGKSLSEGGLEKEYLSRFETVDFFVSHHHGDHFNNIIFSFSRPGVSYYISLDTANLPNIPSLDNINVIQKGDQIKKGDFLIKAFGSTDEGVSYYVETQGKRIFHAGDLNCWHWKNESSKEEAQKARDWFYHELKPIESLPPLDIAFFPVDRRMGDGYFEGALEFARRMRLKLFVPMHFGKDLAAIKPFAKEAEAFCPVWRITKQGDLLELI